jgi:hypothetical protein
MAETKLNSNQLGNDTTVWNQNNLRSGQNVEIAIKTNPYVIDEHTVALWHFDTAKTDVSGCASDVGSRQLDRILGVKNNTDLIKFGEGSAANSYSSDHPGYFAQETMASPFYTPNYSSTSPIPLGNEFTVDFWAIIGRAAGFVITTSTGGYGYVASKEFGLNYSGELYYSKDGSSRITIAQGMKIDGTMHHYAICKDASGMMYGFRDGVLISSADISSDWNTTFSAGGVVRISDGTGDTSHSENYYVIDELRFSNVCRWTTDFDVPTEEYKSSATEDYYVINSTLTAGSNINISNVGVISSPNSVQSTDINQIRKVTQAEYDAMEQAGTLVETTWYLIYTPQVQQAEE